MNTDARVTIVHRHELFAAILQHAVTVQSFECARVVTAGSTVTAVLRRVARSRPDVVLAVADFGHGDDALGSLCRAGHRVVALTEDAQPFRLGEALAAGAVAVVAKSASLGDMLDVLSRVVSGDPGIESGRRDELVGEYQRTLGDDRDLVARLTRQEKDLLAHLMAGRGVAEVAALRVVSEATVRTQAKAVLVKLGVSSQLTAVAIARRAGHSPSTLHATFPAAS